MRLEPYCPVVVVAGTNGKGSVCAYLTQIYKQAGFKVGTLTSPHLLRYNEHIGCLQDWWPQAAPLPAHIRLYARLQDVPLHECAAVLWATAAATQVPPGLEQQLDGKLVIYRVPPSVPASASAPAAAPAPQAGARYSVDRKSVV